jgi:hypothetical protein
MWERFTETHVQHGYPVARVRELPEQAGLTVLATYDAHAEGLSEPGPQTGRVLVVARREWEFTAAASPRAARGSTADPARR